MWCTKFLGMLDCVCLWLLFWTVCSMTAKMCCPERYTACKEIVSEINAQLRQPSLWPFISQMLGEILNLRNMLNPPRRSYLSGLNAREEHRCVTSFTNAQRERKPKTSEDGEGANDFWSENYSQDMFVMVCFITECSAVNGRDLTSLNFCSENDWAQTWICLTPCGCFIFMTNGFCFVFFAATCQCFVAMFHWAKSNKT